MFNRRDENMSLLHSIGPDIWMKHSEIPPTAILFKKGTPLLEMSQRQLMNISENIIYINENRGDLKDEDLTYDDGILQWNCIIDSHDRIKFEFKHSDNIIQLDDIQSMLFIPYCEFLESARLEKPLLTIEEYKHE